MAVFSVLLTSLPLLTFGVCPGEFYGTPTTDNADIPPLDEYNAALEKLDIKAVIADLQDLFVDNQECWPADTFCAENKCNTSYAGLFVRLSWHCSGTYRISDGVGGCSGGRQRFQPENSWADNTNLDKARGLLWPIKEKYGIGLSWGDLMILGGTAAIIDGGGPIDSICVGRVDDANGNKSLPLGPGPEAPPCPVEGDCQPPLGTSTVGLIYVNPQGYLGEPDPSKSAIMIRDVFGRMGMNDTETVALIGGGHAFGKSHGACPKGAGPPPNEQPENPWPGMCGNGKGNDTYTSGIEGQWTTHPFEWDNEYFQQLVNDEYELIKGPGGAWQWMNQRNGYMMFTTDRALVNDTAYNDIVHRFAQDLDYLSMQFAAAWKKLTEDGGVWAKNKKCIEWGTYKKHHLNHAHRLHG